MTNVHFYILETAVQQQRLLMACHFIEKQYHAQQSVYIHVDSAEIATRFDQLLWTFRDNSFLPHHIVSNQIEPIPPILIGYDANHLVPATCFINLSTHFPQPFLQYTEVIEIVIADPVQQQTARERYKQYRDQQAHLQTHKLSASEISKCLAKPTKIN